MRILRRAFLLWCKRRSKRRSYWIRLRKVLVVRVSPAHRFLLSLATGASSDRPPQRLIALLIVSNLAYLMFAWFSQKARRRRADTYLKKFPEDEAAVSAILSAKELTATTTGGSAPGTATPRSGQRRTGNRSKGNGLQEIFRERRSSTDRAVQRQRPTMTQPGRRAPQCGSDWVRSKRGL